jgi:hypothetical protein
MFWNRKKNREDEFKALYEESLKKETTIENLINSGCLVSLTKEEYKTWLFRYLRKYSLSSIVFETKLPKILKVTGKIYLPSLYGALSKSFYIPIGIYVRESGHSTYYYEEGETNKATTLEALFEWEYEIRENFLK